MRLAICIILALCSFLLPFIARFVRNLRWGLPVRIVVDPENPDPNEFASYLAQVASRLDEHPERMRIVIETSNVYNKAFRVDWGRNREMSVELEKTTSAALNLRGRWIPDHPVPLVLKPHGRCILYVDPVDANRFRVMTSPSFGWSGLIDIFSMICATIAIVYVLPELLVFSIGLSVGAACLRLSK